MKMKTITLYSFFILMILLAINVSAGELIIGFDFNSSGLEAEIEIKKLCLEKGFSELSNEMFEVNDTLQLYKRITADDRMFLITMRKCKDSSNQIFISTEIINAKNGIIIFHQMQEGANLISSFRDNKNAIFKIIENYNEKFVHGELKGINLSIIRNDPCNNLSSLFITRLIKTEGISILTRRYVEECLFLQESFAVSKRQKTFKQKMGKLKAANGALIIQGMKKSSLNIKAIEVDGGAVVYEQTVESSSDMDLFIKNILSDNIIKQFDKKMGTIQTE